jgi:hypothetical protein
MGGRLGAVRQRLRVRYLAGPTAFRMRRRQLKAELANPDSQVPPRARSSALQLRRLSYILP